MGYTVRMPHCTALLGVASLGICTSNAGKLGASLGTPRLLRPPFLIIGLARRRRRRQPCGMWDVVRATELRATSRLLRPCLLESTPATQYRSAVYSQLEPTPHVLSFLTHLYITVQILTPFAVYFTCLIPNQACIIMDLGTSPTE